MMAILKFLIEAIIGIAILLACVLFSSLLFAEPAIIQNNQLVVPRVDFSDMGPVEIRFDNNTSDGISLVTDSYIDADPVSELSGIFDEATGSLELFEVRLPGGKSWWAMLEMVSPDDNETFVLRAVQPLTNEEPAPNPDNHDAPPHTFARDVF